jgi:hypothetical protein
MEIRLIVFLFEPWRRLMGINGVWGLGSGVWGLGSGVWGRESGVGAGRAGSGVGAGRAGSEVGSRSGPRRLGSRKSERAAQARKSERARRLGGRNQESLASAEFCLASDVRPQTSDQKTRPTPDPRRPTKNHVWREGSAISFVDHLHIDGLAGD